MVQRTGQSWQTNRLRLFLVKNFRAGIGGALCINLEALNIWARGEGINLYTSSYASWSSRAVLCEGRTGLAGQRSSYKLQATSLTGDKL